jgi:hypothetical protein
MMIAADRAERSRSSTNAMAPPDTNCARTAGSFFSIGSRRAIQGDAPASAASLTPACN